MKLNHDSLWTITNLEFRILTAVEMASKNHSIVPIDLIKKLSKVQCNFQNVFMDLCKSKFLKYENDPYLGYRLTISGYDCLAVTTLRKRGLKIMGDKIGIGKESDIYYGEYNNEKVILKFHRIGRTSFRNVKNKRDYHEGRKHCSWLYLSRLSAEKEYDYMKLFYNKIDMPKPYDNNRHVIVMEYLEDYIPLYTIEKGFPLDVDAVYNNLMNMIDQLYNLGYVHGDFNEFNIMINHENQLKVIDFPQCVDLKNQKAVDYLNRDIKGINTYFKKKFKYINQYESDFAILK